MPKFHILFLVAASASVFVSCTTVRTVEVASPPDPNPNHFLAGAGADARGHTEKAHIVDPVPRQVLLTTKFVETSTKELKAHDTLTDPQFQRRIRKLSQTKGADLMTAPSVVTRSQQRAKVEIIREMPMKGGAYDEQINLGLTLDVLPTVLKDGRIHLSGKGTLREMETVVPQFDGNTAIAVQSSDLFFDAIIRDGQTVQVICRDKNTPGQQFAFITARLIDTQGQPIKKP